MRFLFVQRRPLNLANHTLVLLLLLLLCWYRPVSETHISYVTLFYFLSLVVVHVSFIALILFSFVLRCAVSFHLFLCIRMRAY